MESLSFPPFSQIKRVTGLLRTPNEIGGGREEQTLVVGNAIWRRRKRGRGSMEHHQGAAYWGHAPCRKGGTLVSFP